MKKSINIILYILLWIMPPLWVIIWASFQSWKLYRREYTTVHNNFYTFLYYQNFTSEPTFLIKAP